MTEFNRRLRLMEAKVSLRLVSGMSPKVRRALTDRAVLHGDQEAMSELSACRPTAITGTNDQRDAAVAAALRADG